MEWQSSSIEPNLKIALELKGDLKTKYLEQYDKAQKTLLNFSSFLQNIYVEHQKLLTENLDLFVTVEKLRNVIDDQKSNQKVATNIEPKLSTQILGSSPNCKLKISSKLSIVDKNNSSDVKSSSTIQKENVNDVPPIYSEDFNSDVEDESFVKHKSPQASVVNSPVKIQSSPILGKRKKSGSKKSNSSINTSSQSIDSNNDSKVSLVNASSFEKNIDIDHDLSKEFEKEYVNEPLKPIENILQSSSCQNNQDKNVAQKVLNVSKTNYAKTEFLDKGKKSRQTMLSFKKVTPVMDISKVDLDESLVNQSMSLIKRGNSWNENCYNNSISSQNSDSILTNMKKFNSPRTGVKTAITSKHQNSFAKEDEFIDVSPVQNEKSKLRNKLSLNKKVDTSSVKNKVSSSTSNNNILKQKNGLKNGVTETKCQKRNNAETNVPQRSISDETYFSPAEMANHKTDMTYFDVDLTEFEDEDMDCSTPPAKKFLLNSFDIIPGRYEKTPDYAYKEGPVRKKSEKEKLEGWDCRECYEYYKHLPEKERKERQNKCSRHRGKYQPDPQGTPDSFWYPGFDTPSQDLSMFND